MTDRRLRDVAVVGGGLAGWTAAAAIARRMRGARIALTQPVDAPASVLDRIGIAAPSARVFHRDIGIDEGEFVRRTGAGFRLGSLVEGWSSKPFVHGYGDHGATTAGVPFHQLWLAATGAEPFHRYALAAAAALAGRFAPDPRFAHGYHFDPAAAAALMRMLASAAGVVALPPCRAAEPDGAGGVALRLADGAAIRPHLVVDATPDGRVAAVLDAERRSWRDELACDRLLVADRPERSAPALHDRLTAWTAGWQLAAPRPGRTTNLLAYATAHASADRAGRALHAAAATDRAIELAWSSGRRTRAWVGNVVAVGEAAVVAEPLEGAALHLLHAHLDRMLANLPDRDFAAIELAGYNREVAQEADRVRDFLQTRYRLSKRREPFWRDAARVAPSDALAYDLMLFRERGRLPVHDEETFDRDSWLATLLGMGVRPRRGDALAAGVPPVRVAALLKQFRGEVTMAVAAMPTHAGHLARVHGVGAGVGAA